MSEKGDFWDTKRAWWCRSPLTTTIYTHPSDEELHFRIRGLDC